MTAANHGRPPQPKSILRGHKAQVHAAAFVRANERLVTGDADGFIVVWDLAILRPRAVWQAHDKAILGIAGLGRDRLITHGRDSKLIVWKLAADDEATLSTRLPLDVSPEPRPRPWMLHMLAVNTINFCAFSHCPASPVGNARDAREPDPAEVLVAVPNTLASEAIDIFHLPSQTLQHTVKLGDKNGMVMALSLLHLADTLTLVAGYENGMAIVARLDPQGTWTITYQAQAHSQPILSLDVSPSHDYFVTSGADAPAPAASAAPAPDVQTRPLKTVNTKHAGQQSLRIRSDGRVLATAGWDSRVRVYSAKTLAEAAVLKWHAVGCYAAAFAEVDPVLPGSSSPSSPSSPAPLAGAAAVAGAAVAGAAAADKEDKEETGQADEPTQGDKDDERGGRSNRLVAVPKLVAVTVGERRRQQATTARWLAAGSKDGKVSLWDVF
ncbi:hypothetical protein VTJ83DRAFT_5089 [Remersonia thermophila]|uniref:ASTRA-associated protein 1 n=1 Tax=Remersonia thermophila TaxID=72144 RepID=A0ABR4DE01_9PEZI